MLRPPPVEPEYWAERRKSVQEGRLENTTLSLLPLHSPPTVSPASLVEPRHLQVGLFCSQCWDWKELESWAEGCRVSNQVTSNPEACNSKRWARRGHRRFRIQHTRRVPPLHSNTVNTSTLRGPSGLPVLPERLQFSLYLSQVLGPVLTVNSDSL